jgi:hypothetical protein
MSRHVKYPACRGTVRGKLRMVLPSIDCSGTAIMYKTLGILVLLVGQVQTVNLNCTARAVVK